MNHPSASASDFLAHPDEACDRARERFIEGLELLDVSDLKEEIKTLLIEASNVVETPLETILIRLHTAINEATVTGRKLRDAIAAAARSDALAADKFSPPKRKKP